MRTIITLSVSLAMGVAAAWGGDLLPGMVQKGAPLLEDSFTGSLDTNKWKVAIGEWKIENGALAGTERPADHHAAVIKTPFTHITAAIQFSFMIKGDSRLHVTFNDKGGHNSYLQIRPYSLVLYKHGDRKDPRSYSPILDETGATISPDTWHTMMVELNGPEMLARVDGTTFVYGSHPGIDQEKTDLLFAAPGAVLIKDVKIWSATPCPSWPEAKARLLAQQAGRPAVDRSTNPQDAYLAAEVKARDRLMKSDEKFKSLVEVRACAMEALAKAFPVVNRKGPKADAEKKRLAGTDDKYKQLQKDVQAALKNEHNYLFAQAPEVKAAWDAMVAANRAKAKGADAEKK